MVLSMLLFGGATLHYFALALARKEGDPKDPNAGATV